MKYLTIFIFNSIRDYSDMNQHLNLSEMYQDQGVQSPDVIDAILFEQTADRFVHTLPRIIGEIARIFGEDVVLANVTKKVPPMSANSYDNSGSLLAMKKHDSTFFASPVAARPAKPLASMAKDGGTSLSFTTTV